MYREGERERMKESNMQKKKEWRKSPLQQALLLTLISATPQPVPSLVRIPHTEFVLRI
jgi:hypothetical protein